MIHRIDRHRFMRMRSIYFVALIFFLLSSSARNSSPADKAFIHPLKPPIHISGSFAEYRKGGRYHYGLDYKTFNRVGLPVYMPSPGYLRMIQVSNRGYGNALFAVAGDSRLTFAHLQDFQGTNPSLEDLRVALELTRPGKFAFLQLPAWFRFKRGAQIARSGESGSGAPHLHFEIIRRGTYFNPLARRGMKIKDVTAPRLLNLYWQTKDASGRIALRRSNPDTKEVRASVKNGVLQQYVFSTKTQTLGLPPSKSVRFYIGAYDTMAAQNRNGVQKIRLLLNEKEVFRNELNSIAIRDLHRADETYEPARTVIGREYVYLLFSSRTGRAALHLKKMRSDRAASGIRVGIRIDDASGNESRLDFKLITQDTARSLSPTESSTGQSGREHAAVKMQKILPRRSFRMRARSGAAVMEFRFAPDSIHLPGFFALNPLRKLPREGTLPREDAGAKKVKGNAAFRAVGPGFAFHSRGAYYKRGVRGIAEFPATGSGRESLYRYSITLGRWLLLAHPRKKRNGKNLYRFRYRFSGPIAQLEDLEVPKIRQPFYWKGPEKSAKKGMIRTIQYGLYDRGSGIAGRDIVVLFDGRPYPYQWIWDRSSLLIRVPEIFYKKSGALLSVQVRDRAGNVSPWAFTYLE